MSTTLVAITYKQELAKQLFLVSAAGLGACFAILYRIGREVARATYDLRQGFSVLVDLVLGLVAGVILSQLVPVGSVGKLGTLTKPTLALLGGFSAKLVFNILTRIVQAVESLFSPDPQAEQDGSAAKAANDVRDARSGLARDLVRLRVANPAGLPPDALDPFIDGLTND